MKTKSLLLTTCLTALVVGVTSCGDSGNMFELLATNSMSDEDKARSAFESGNYAEATKLLQAQLLRDPNNSTLKAKLGTSALKAASIDEMKLLGGIANLAGSIEGGDVGNPLLAIASTLPAPTAANIANVTTAYNALKSIPTADLTEEQKVNLTVASVSLVSMQLSNLSTADGEVDAAKMKDLSDAEADLIVAAAFTGINTLGDTMNTEEEGNAINVMPEDTEGMSSKDIIALMIQFGSGSS